jgi:hypothetical protein
VLMEKPRSVGSPLCDFCVESPSSRRNGSVMCVVLFSMLWLVVKLDLE